jgi:thiamine kinase-like enzyme
MSIYKDNPNSVYRQRVDDESGVVDVILGITKLSKDTNFKIEVLEGGLTNMLYRVEAKSTDGADEYVVRIFGEGSNSFIDRRIENIVFSTLSKVGFCAPFIGLFENGRVEGFISSGKAATKEDFATETILPHIAEVIGRMHTLHADIDHGIGIWPKLHNMVALATGELLRMMDKEISNRNADISNTPDSEVTSGQQQLMLVVEDEDEDGGASSSVTAEALVAEAEWLQQSTLAEIRRQQDLSASHSGEQRERLLARGALFGYDSVLAHNDLTPGNVLLQSAAAEGGGPPVTLIDFEYSSYNYRAFDLANFFCGTQLPTFIICTLFAINLTLSSLFAVEFGGFDYDESLFPEQHTRLAVYRSYLQAAAPTVLSELDSSDQFVHGLDVSDKATPR